MTLRHLGVALGTLLIVGWGALYALTPAEGDGVPMSGVLAPLDTSRVGPWEEVARLAVDDIGGLRINGLDMRGDTLVVVQATQWHLVVGGALQGSFGSDVQGSPEFLARAVGAALLPHSVVVFDGLMHRASQWSRDGVRDRSIDLRGRVGLGIQHHFVIAADSGLFVPGYQMTDVGGEWQLVRVTATTVDTLIKSHRMLGDGGAYDTPLPLPLPDGSYYVLDASTWRIRFFNARGVETRAATVRADAPRFPVPRKLATRMRRHLSRAPEAQRSAVTMGATLPPVRAATLAADGNLLVLTSTDEEATILELVSPSGAGIATLWSNPVQDRTFAVRGAIYRVRELDDVVVIDRQRPLSTRE